MDGFAGCFFLFIFISLYNRSTLLTTSLNYYIPTEGEMEKHEPTGEDYKAFIRLWCDHYDKVTCDIPTKPNREEWVIKNGNPVCVEFRDVSD